MYRVVKKTESSGRDGKSIRRFSNFHFSKACKIELCVFREAGAFYQNRQWNVASGLFLQPCTVRGLNIGQFKGFSLGPLRLPLIKICSLNRFLDRRRQ